MRTTITVDDTLFEEAQRMANANRHSDLFSMGLRALVKQEKAKRLAALGGSLPEFVTPPRDR